MPQRRSPEHRLAQKLGKILDEYTCFFCEKQIKATQGHHIIPYSEGGEASIYNIITLCPKCHEAYHRGEIKLDITRF